MSDFKTDHGTGWAAVVAYLAEHAEPFTVGTTKRTWRSLLAGPLRRTDHRIWSYRWVYEGRLPRWQEVGNRLRALADRIDPRPKPPPWSGHHGHVHGAGW